MSESRKTEKKERRKQLERHILAIHDFEEGQVWSWLDCGVRGTDVCSICGLRAKWGRGGQRGESYTEYESAAGVPLTLAQAARLECD